jgi:hypothetical protein
MRRRAFRGVLAGACVAAAVGVLAAPAAAGGRLTVLHTGEPGITPRFGPPLLVAGPRLMGDSTAWAGLTRRGYAVHVTAPGGRDRVVGEVRVPLPWPHPHRGYYGRLEASPARLAFSLRVTPCWGAFAFECELGGEVGEVRTATPSGPLERLAGCEGDGCERCPYSDGVPVDVAGDEVLYGRPCHRGRAFVRSFAPGADSKPDRLPDGSERLTADFLGVARRGRLRVVSRATGRIVYSIHTGYVGVLDDLQPDGKLAYGAPDYSECQVEQCPDELPSWASPGEPRGHAVGDDAILRIYMRMAGDLIAYRPFGSPPYPESRIGVVDLDGDTVAVANATGAIGDMDFDGRHLTYAVRPCGAIGVVVWDLVGSPPRFPRGSCPVPRIARDPVRRTGAPVPVRVTCPERGLLGCAGTIRLVADASHPGGGGQGARDTRSLGQTEYTVRPGATRTLRFPVDDAGRAFLAAHRDVRIDVGVASPDRADTGQAGLTSHGTFRLLD